MVKPAEEDIDAKMKLELEGSNPHELTAKDIAEAKAKALDTLQKDKRATAIKKLIADETERLKMVEGMVSGDPVADERVNITIDLPEFSANITINMEAYWHGQTYNVPRHVANTLREIQQRTWLHLHEIEGKTLTQSKSMVRDTVLSAVSGVHNAPSATA